MTHATTLEPRMTHPTTLVPDSLKALYALHKSAQNEGVPTTTRYLVHLRASQINGCSYCAEMHSRELKEAGERDERIWTVAAWRESRHFSEGERAALALTEAVTRLSDRSDPVPDDVWEEAARHYDEQALSALLLDIAGINVWNRLNVATRQLTG